MTKIDDLIAELNQKRAHVFQGGGPEQIDKQHKLGKLTARERLGLLLDEDSFTEYDPWLKNRCFDFEMHKRDLPGEGAVTGWGRINGNTVHVFAQDFTLMGGSLGEAQGLKICRLIDQAIKTGSPLIGINDSGGARIQEGMGALNGYCSLFYRNSIASGWIPQISVVLGPCAGGAVYSPALTDFIIVVDPITKMFITGPAVIKAVTGEEVGVEELGGAKVHSRLTGVAHFERKSEQEAMALVRKLLSYLPPNSKEKPPRLPTDDPIYRWEPELRDLIPINQASAYDMREIIKKVVDNGDFLEVHSLFATNIVVGFARLDGYPVGIVGNQPRFLAGCLDVNASWKSARFVRFCDAFNLPLVTFVDCPGYLPGVNQEHQGIIRNGAKLLYAYSEATVPKITVVTRKDYGGAYSAMCGKGLGADLVLALPTAEIAVVGPDAAVNIVFRSEIESSPNPEILYQEKVKEYREKFATPYKAAEWGLVDDIVDPAELRPKLIEGLKALREKEEWRPYKKHSNLPL
ncbi:MAG: acyl-CoA carboxylase subunit beta [Peptococcaceae bacterium]|nr:methylmalonyl-CoA carboxyltransferase [Peptococcaceae bacterium]MDH7526397.1 acyl-CoA carboxylase subunit beta [Peptococcaceae bacterium]